MAETKNRVRHWRGTVDSYNVLAKAGALDYWTRYSVKYVDEATGVISWKEYYGDNLITESTGQLLPVIDIVSALPSSLNPGDRYLVGQDGIGYFLVDVGVYREDAGGYSKTTKTKTLEEGISVRVKNRGYKSYLVINGNIRTYDDVDCGSYE
jgi:hypothetical protein